MICGGIETKLDLFYSFKPCFAHIVQCVEAKAGFIQAD